MTEKRSVPASLLHQRPLRMVTRPSPLAIRQGELCKSHLLSVYDLREGDITLHTHTTQGDRYRGHIADIGGKGVFIKDIEQCLLSNDADIAVHSLKDVPAKLDARFHLACMLARADWRDGLIVPVESTIHSIADLAIADLASADLASADLGLDADSAARLRIGTSSPRRIAQLGHLNAAVIPIPLRGNIATRLQKIIDGGCDGAILSCAGLERLGTSLKEYNAMLRVIPISADVFLPAAGQGVIVMETLSSRTDLRDFLHEASDKETATHADAERRAVEILDGSCVSPIGAFARRVGANRMRLDVQVFSPDGRDVFHRSGTCAYGEAASLSATIGHALRKDVPAFILGHDAHDG